jgi:hypothetical protein
MVKERQILARYEDKGLESPLFRARRTHTTFEVPEQTCYHAPRKSADDLTLAFESRFESGNLFLAQKVSDQEYNCLMQNDINSKGHT